MSNYNSEKCRLFIRFLKIHNAYHKFLTNLNLQCKYGRFLSLLESNVTIGIIDRSLCWNETAEGFDYWDELDFKFNQIAEKIKEKVLKEKE